MFSINKSLSACKCGYGLISLFACGVISHAFVVVCRLFFQICFFKKFFQCHSLDPDQDRHSVTNCLQSYSADGKGNH